MAVSIEEQLREFADWNDAAAPSVSASEVIGAALDEAVTGQPSHRGRTNPRLVVGAAAALLVTFTVAAIGYVGRADRSAPSDTVPPTVITPPTTTADAVHDDDVGGGVLPTRLPEDLTFRGSESDPTPAVSMPDVFMWSSTASIRIDIGDPEVAANLPRPDDVEQAIDRPRLDEDGWLILDWTGDDGAIILVTARHASPSDVATVARRADAHFGAGGSTSPGGPLSSTPDEVAGFEVPAEFQLLDQDELPSEVEHRWTNATESRGVAVRTQARLPHDPPLPSLPGTRWINRSDTSVVRVRSFGLSEHELDAVIASLAPVDGIQLPEPNPITRPAPTADTVFASDPSASPRWQIEGRILVERSKPMMAISGLVEMPTEQQASRLDPFDALVEAAVLPVDGERVLVIYTADGVTSLVVVWIDTNGDVITSEQIGGHLADMVAGGYPPLAAATVPADAVAVEVTPLAATGQDMSDPMRLDDLTASAMAG